MVTGVDHVAIAARDPRALAAWYRDVLGMRILFENGQDPPTYLVGGPTAGMIEIMPERGFPRPEREFYAPGISHLALLVEDFDAAYAALQGRVEGLADPLPAAGGGFIANFLDPEGNPVQIVARPSDPRAG
jgi:catechol 2,3-dioxygenase-like lactoylglutathione lyase family enzyme